MKVALNLVVIAENWLLVTDSPVEFEIQLNEVQDFTKITDHWKVIYGIYLN